MSPRYEFPEDRFNFRRWVVSKGPCKKTYWWFDYQQQMLYLDLEKGERRKVYLISKAELDSFRGGWRTLVAQALLILRHALREETE